MPRPSIALIANPRSGSSDPGEVASYLRDAGAEVELFALDEAERAGASGASRIVIAGGDGSVGPVAAIAGGANLPLGVMAAGTANDFARGMGLPQDLEEAARLAVRGTRLRALELGWMAAPGGDSKGRPFVNVASLGLPAPAAERAGSLKATLGPLAYAVGALGAGLSARPVRCRATCDGSLVHDGPAWQVTVACSGAFGAGARIEEADPTDGELDLVAAAAGSRLRLPALAYRLRRGGLTERAGIGHARGASIELDAPANAEFNVDGELVRHGPATFTAEAGAFRLVVG
jgi:diacylglycerol kinase (ATP)